MILPTGTTIYKKEKCCSGYNLVATPNSGVLLFDMNGNEIKHFKMNAMPAKMLSNGNVIGTTKFRKSDYSSQDGESLIEVNQDGKVVWSYNKFRFLEKESIWSARAHGDYHRLENGNTLILGHDTIVNTEVSDKKLLDEVIYEVDLNGNVVWKFSFSNHFNEIGYTEVQKNVIYRNPNIISNLELGDYLHISSFGLVGENKWYEQGDRRFNPENIIFASRQSNFIGIIDKKKRKIVWQIGPKEDSLFRKLHGIIGPTHIQIIPKGLNGEGNILLFESGAESGYGVPNLNSSTGINNYRRAYSRVLEFNPITYDIKWMISPRNLGYSTSLNGYKFYSPYGGSLQRLQNGNTLVSMGSAGTIYEITEDHEVVWRWVCPYRVNSEQDFAIKNYIYQGFRYPYEYLDREKPEEISIDQNQEIKFNNFVKVEETFVEGAQIQNDIDFMTMAMENEDEIALQREIISMESSKVKFISTKNFEKRISENPKSIVIYGGKSCVHCKSVREIVIELIEEEFDEISAFYLDIDENKSVRRTQNIDNVPLTVMYKNGVEVHRFVGEVTYDDMALKIEEYLL
ncbi:Thioredoxin [Peptoniphilus asaccharolyticus DSM 20463]|uniref:Thioredoxin n=1 Tax=Peptoniphilus asaccharolyticus DSM 20463 TaxID=573058 RepID=A0A1W1V0L3_PEPAS|nr:aryl-sulfate sulfotransferase [Peptoniphilus asaccharolyticus]MBL7575460.1 aryl-sulfate sulfotransferase [Peptoniphilus asaccharolyticus]SMB86843.1 Thioredoxin [Peptoniphilus asaccharolyticus DSM 20463]